MRTRRYARRYTYNNAEGQRIFEPSSTDKTPPYLAEPSIPNVWPLQSTRFFEQIF